MRLFILIFMLLTQPVFAGQGDSQDLSKFFDQTPKAPTQSTPASDLLPDLSKAPKWRDIATKQEFQALPPAKQAEAKVAYFDYWIAPHVVADGLTSEFAEVRTEFLRRMDVSPDIPAPPVNVAKGTPGDSAQSLIAGSVTLYGVLLQVVAFGGAWTIGFLLNRSELKLWRQVVGFLAGLAIGGPAVIAAWAFAMDALMPEIPGAFKQLIPTMMGKAIWSAVLGAGLGVYFGRQKAKSKATASTDAHSVLATPAQFVARLSTMKLPAISLERALLGIIAASTLAIAVKLWFAPAPVSHEDFAAIDKIQELGADPKTMNEKRDELNRRIPLVRNVGR
ncbi:MAG: hypothetical protein Q8O38_09975 [Sulfurimicrobium sp.]|nr:hypothetical protein [Sulfurimicrobium sp.]